MSPPFRSRSRSLLFALLLALLLALPALMATTGWLDRRDVYPAIAWKHGPFPWIQQKIFRETGDVDIAFVGSSRLWVAVNSPYVQKRLSAQLGRESTVFSLGWPWGGFDAVYIIARDLLDHRHIHTLVICDEGPIGMPQFEASHWFRMGENSEALAGLPLSSQVRLYGEAVLGMPRQLLSLVRPNLIDDPLLAKNTFWDTYYRAPNVAANLGSLRARLAWGYNGRDFVSFKPGGGGTPDDALVYSAAYAGAFNVTGPRTDENALHFVRKLAELCRQRGTQLVILQPPFYSERTEKRIPLRERWPDVLGAPVRIVGVAPARLFTGMSDDTIQKLFYEERHLNENGQALFTPIVTPTLLRLYAESGKLP
jgi:hypothetical protein